MASTKETVPYNACVNPPRKAKRARIEPTIAPPPPSVPVQMSNPQARQRPHILPRDPHGSPSNGSPADRDSSDDDDDYDSVEPVPAPKRRGRKPGPLSRTARESQRKLNHSRIEKARRTKINETLATLSNLVNDVEKQRAAASGSKPVMVEEKSKGEKEFKLDVLVKTVSYVQELIDRVKTLEMRSCSRCSTTPQSTPVSPPESPTIRRKRKVNDLDVDVEILEVGDDADGERDSITKRASGKQLVSTTSPPSRASSKAPSQSPCLPSISSWLPNPYVDPSCLPSIPDTNASSSHLPTPPLSGSFRAPFTLASQAPPALTLPGPAHPLPAESFAASSRTSKAMRIALPTRRMSNAAAVSPSWTSEDETAASLLLQMSSSPNTGSSRLRGNSLETARSRSNTSATPVQAETPSSLLGLGHHG